jgi:hypothetical protein
MILRRAIWLALVTSAALASLAAAPSGGERWLVTVEGPVKTRCVATITESRDALSGVVACREAGVELRIDGRLQGALASGTAPGGVSWTSSRDGAGLVGTYRSPRGAGTWSARRAPSGG